MANSRLNTILQLKKHPLPFSDLFITAVKFGMNENQMSLLAEVSLRTFKTKSKTSMLSFRISERVVMLNDLYQIGIDVFDSNEASFQDWLKNKIPALNNNIPNDLLTSLLGIDVVKEELQRIEHGVY